MNQLTLIPPKKAQGLSIETQKEIISVYEALVAALQKEVDDFETSARAGGIEKAKITTLEYWRLREELLRQQDALKLKRQAYNMFLGRAKVYEEVFENNSKICNDNFEKIISELRKRSLADETCKKILDIYQEKEENILKDQELKNDFYNSAVTQLKRK
jgi:hypothetical protein